VTTDAFPEPTSCAVLAAAAGAAAAAAAAAGLSWCLSPARVGGLCSRSGPTGPGATSGGPVSDTDVAVAAVHHNCACYVCLAHLNLLGGSLGIPGVCCCLLGSPCSFHGCHAQCASPVRPTLHFLLPCFASHRLRLLSCPSFCHTTSHRRDADLAYMHCCNTVVWKYVGAVCQHQCAQTNTLTRFPSPTA
jgi:hypothetical protein